MKEENKKEIKKNVMAGVGTAAGAVFGTVVENAMNPSIAEAGDKEEPEVLEAVVEEETEAIPSIEDNDTSIEVPVMNVEPTHASSSPAKKPIHTANAVSPNLDTAAAESTEDLESVSLTDSELQPEVVMAEEETEEDDIPVVTIETNSDESSEDLTDETIEAVTVYDSDEPLDYAGLDDSESKAHGSALGDASLDLPDYVNNANIDSFTDLE